MAALAALFCMALTAPALASASAHTSAKRDYFIYDYRVCGIYGDIPTPVGTRICLRVDAQRQSDGQGFITTNPRVYAVDNVSGEGCGRGLESDGVDLFTVYVAGRTSGGNTYPRAWERTTPNLTNATNNCYVHYTPTVSTNADGITVAFGFKAHIKLSYDQSDSLFLYINPSNFSCASQNHDVTACDRTVA